MWVFAGIIFLFVAGLGVRATVHHGFKWWKTKGGKRVAFGLILGPAAVWLLGSLGGCSSVEVYAGLERTKSISPQCDQGGADDQLTSNLGLRGCRVLSSDGRTTLCGVYRHHSCAISQDRESYDAFGATVTREIYRK